MLWSMLKWTIWPIFFTLDFEGWPWPWHITPQSVRLHEIHILTKYQVSICNGSNVMANVKVVWPKLYIWPLTLKNDLDLKLLHSKCAASWDAPVHQISNVYLYWIKCYGQSESGLFDLYCLPDLEGWPWPWQITPQNVRLEQMHMHAKYQESICNGSKVMANVKVSDLILCIWYLTLKDHFELNMSPLKMWGSLRYICMPNIKSL